MPTLWEGGVLVFVVDIFLFLMPMFAEGVLVVLAAVFFEKNEFL